MKRLFASPLSRRFAFVVIATSTVITLVMTSIQLWLDYRTNIASMHDALSQVEASYSSSLTSSLWTYDHALVQSQLDGIANLIEIEWAQIETEDGSTWTAGERRSTYTLQEQVPLTYSADNHVTTVGQLTLLSSIDSIYWSLAKKFTVILFLNLIKTLCMSVGHHLSFSSYRRPPFDRPSRQSQDIEPRRKISGFPPARTLETIRRR